jgi:hypothetical protein
MNPRVWKKKRKEKKKEKWEALVNERDEGGYNAKVKQWTW